MAPRLIKIAHICRNCCNTKIFLSRNGSYGFVLSKIANAIVGPEVTAAVRWKERRAHFGTDA